MSYKPFTEAHPELSCASEDEALFEEYRATFKYTSDIAPHELQVATLEDSGHKYFVTEPRKAESQGIAALHYSWGNSDLPGLALRSQLAADLAQMTIVNFPNNLGRETNEWYSREQLRRVAGGDMAAIALPRLIIAANIAKDHGFDRLHSLGWSEGAAIAGASGGLDFSDTVGLGNIMAGEAPNVVRRSLPRLGRDFAADTTYIEQAKVTGITALSERYEQNAVQGLIGATEFVLGALGRRSNRAKAKGFSRGTFEKAIFSGLHHEKATKLLLSSGTLSRILPPVAAEELVGNLQAHFPDVVAYTQITAAHAGADDIRTHAVLVRSAVDL